MVASRERRLAVIMFTDMVAYPALSQANEGLALATLESHRALVRPIVAVHNGTEIKTMGDSFLIEFKSALEATECAVDLQKALHEQDQGDGGTIAIRVGLHVGDVVHRDEDVYGDAVNIASRVYPLARPGQICMTRQVYDQVRNKIDLRTESLGQQRLKNIVTPLEVFRVVLPWDQPEKSAPRTDRRRIAVLPFANMSPDKEDEYLADGMTEELIASLSEVEHLAVVARTSVMRYKTTSKGVSEIAQELGVGTIVEGSVRKAKNKVRITVKAINASTEEHIWSQTFDREVDDVFSVQTEIAEKAVKEVAFRLLEPRFLGGHG